MRTLAAVVEEVRALPVPDRLRLVEQIVHEIAEASAGATPAAPARPPKVSPVGWLADEPELADQFEKLMVEVRAQGRPRGFEDDENTD
jgi:hypothetical protein